jgi:acyl-CoA thioester hydrolase
MPGSLLQTFGGSVLKEWTDYNGHMRDAYYLLVFSLATDGLMEQIALGEVERATTGNSLFTLETHLNFLDEAHGGDAIEVQTQILASDAKRLRIFHRLFAKGTERLLACNEQVLLHVSLTTRKATVFEGAPWQQVQRLSALHAALDWPAMAGRAITWGNRGA